MIGFFTNASDTDMIDFVTSAAHAAAPTETVEVIPIQRRPDSEVLRSRSFASELLDMNACVLDCDQASPMAYAAELGSLGKGIAYWSGANRYDLEDDDFESLDHRILLLTREGSDDHVNRYFRDYYTILKVQPTNLIAHHDELAKWLRETVNRTAPKVFVSYRSSQREFARNVADALRAKGAFVWFDEMSIVPGQSIPGEINRGIGWASHLVLVIDESFFKSKWTKAEYESALFVYMGERSGRRGSGPILPIFLIDPSDRSLPPMLRRIRGIDARSKSLDEIVTQLWNALTIVGYR